MVSLWGSKNGEEHDEGDDAEQNGDDSNQQTRRSGGREPDERTRLLPPRSDGFLDPDDPAVCCTEMRRQQYTNSLSGIPVQSLERSGSPLLYRPLCHNQLPLVGAAPRLNLRQPADDAFSWLRLLRFLIHHPHAWQPSCRHPLLLYTFQSHASG